MKLAVDVIAYRGDGKICFVERKFAPYQDCIALPGGFVEDNETIADAAARELLEETGISISANDLKEIGVYDKVDRDPRWRVISFCFFVHLPADTEARGGDDAVTAKFFSPAEADLREFAFDHIYMIGDAIEHIIAAEAVDKIKGFLSEAA